MVWVIYGALIVGATLVSIVLMWQDGRPKEPPPAPPPAPPPEREPEGYVLIECELVEPVGDVPELPDGYYAEWDAHARARMDAIEAVGERDGWRCGICHAPAEHLYFVDLHDDDGTLCCAVCSQILDAGALE